MLEKEITGTLVAQPLLEFCTACGLGAPGLTLLDGPDVPEPYRQLLVHRGDMTPTLEAFHGESIHLRIQRQWEQDGGYFRQVALITDTTLRAVEFGAIRIELEAFPEAARRQILQGKRPLGSLLADFKIPHRSEPKAFFSLLPRREIARILGCSRPRRLYGRHNLLLGRQRRRLAEIVELLP